ncbi:hypothetical protein [Allorhizobium taibaishanense]|uniref:Uncharacterized protein n=1 Tax=Allorhizobium taibaishanense TaxID=887144 RepID=A0A1Q9AB71_9HYPH|nr:hypothetical protein [Allorhizobium taibaishanense]MBB4010107.1 hypothetical protein [Allorhizobium taibaishanense]OLP52120.1 hypothetical protein BJF91_02440 [Allorhizobium taibaishanense]
MSWLSFEGVGKVVGGLIGGVGGGLSKAATSPETYAGAMAGAAGGAAAGMVTAGVGEVVTVPGGAVVGGIAGGSKGFVEGFGPGANAGWDAGGNAGKWLDDKITQMTSADKAADKANAKASTITCATCPQNPCAALACGDIPPSNSKYKGGAHGCMKLPRNDELDSHHMPADSKSPLNKEVGPAIQMEPSDHSLTASYKGRVNGPTYAVQRSLLSQGKVYAAFLVDVADAKRVAAIAGDPGRYDDAIVHATAYATCLKRNGIIQ